MRKHRLTVVTRGKTGTIEVFPKQGSDKQTIFKAAKRYGMIAVKESVELGERTKTRTFEFPDNRKAKQFLKDITNSAVANGTISGNRVTDVEPIGHEWERRDAPKEIAKYLKKNRGKEIKESVELDEKHPTSVKIGYSKIVKGIRDSQGPFTVVAIKGKKVVAQKTSIKNSKMLPIEVNDMADAHPGATISIESKDGKILNTFKESVELDEGIRDFKVGDKVKWVGEDEHEGDIESKNLIGQIGIIKTIQKFGRFHKGDIKFRKKLVRGVVLELDVIKESVEELDESRMSELHMLIKQGKSAEQIAKIMKVDVKTIKELMKESVEELDEAEPLRWSELSVKERKDYLKHAGINMPLGDKKWNQLPGLVQKKLQSMIKKTTKNEYELIELRKVSAFKKGDKVEIADKSHKQNGQSGTITQLANKTASVKLDKGGKTIIVKTISLWQDK